MLFSTDAGKFGPNKKELIGINPPSAASSNMSMYHHQIIHNVSQKEIFDVSYIHRNNEGVTIKKKRNSLLPR
jgi:hypothetical protein